MPKLDETDFVRAKDVAIGCLYQGNQLIETARTEPPFPPQGAAHGGSFYKLTGAINTFCGFLDDGRYAIDRVHPYMLAVAGEPIRVGRRYCTTAHQFAWTFAHGLWLSVHGVVCCELVMRNREKEAFDLSPGFGFDHDLLWELTDRLRVELAAWEPIDAQLFTSRIQIENQRALFHFLDGRARPLRTSTRSAGGRPRGSYADPTLDNRVWKAWSTGNFETYADCARDLGEGVDEMSVKQVLDRVRARRRRARHKSPA